MKKIKVELEVEIGDNDVGFVIVPTSSEAALQGPYAVNASKAQGTATAGSSVLGCTWNCKNGVQLRVG